MGLCCKKYTTFHMHEIPSWKFTQAMAYTWNLKRGKFHSNRAKGLLLTVLVMINSNLQIFQLKKIQYAPLIKTHP